MSLSGSQRFNFEELRELIDKAVLNDQMPDKLYKSTDGILRVISSIYKTKGNNWASQVLDDNGDPLLTPEEQAKFTDVFKPYIDSIINFFNSNDSDNTNSSNSSDKTDKRDDNEITGGAAGIDDLYNKIIDSIKNVDSVVNNYASKYGILKLEKKYDLEKSDIGLPSFIATNPALIVLSKIKIPFRTIITTIYLILDITRLSLGSSGSNTGRKILSILVALLELLKGDWKKAILTGIGFYGMSPMLTGQLLKVFLTLFRALSPDIQKSIVFCPLDIGKSLIVGLLLSIFQVTAPASIRQPLIEILNKILNKNPQNSDSWNDLNDIQAIFSNKDYICSVEGRKLIKEVNKSTFIKIILEMLRIPVTDEMIKNKCGQEQYEMIANPPQQPQQQPQPQQGGVKRLDSRSKRAPRRTLLLQNI